MEILDELKQLAVVIQRRKDADHWSHHLFLTRSLPANSTTEGYRALARLAHAGYFSTILTSNTDTTLELALKEQGSSQYKVFVVGHTPDEQVAAVLERQEIGIHVVKLYSHRPQVHQASIPSGLPPELQTSLKYYLNQSIIIVGCMDQEEDGISILDFHKERTIYYVLQNALPPNDAVAKYLHQQDIQLEDFLITGTYGDFNTFFSTLEKNIKDRMGQNQVLPPLHRNITDGTKESSVRNHTGKDLSVTDVINVFYICSSAERDVQLREEIEKHLSSLRGRRIINDWHDGKLDAGTEGVLEIEKHLEDARVILLLVSADLIFLGDNYLVKRAIERHKARSAEVIPIILRPVEWRESIFGALTPLPTGGVAITSWPDCDEACLNVAKGVRKVINNLGDTNS